jgi:hypothetical protein
MAHATQLSFYGHNQNMVTEACMKQPCGIIFNSQILILPPSISILNNKENKACSSIFLLSLISNSIYSIPTRKLKMIRQNVSGSGHSSWA